MPGLANAFLLLFGCSLADFATPLILAGSDFPVLPTEAYLQITGMFDLKTGAILSLLLLVPAGLVFLPAGISGRRPLLRHGHRQGRRRHRSGIRCPAARRLSAPGFLPARLRDDSVFLCAAVLRIDRSGVWRQ